MEPAVCGKDESSECIQRFFRSHQKEWCAFVSQFLPITPMLPLLTLAKFFVIQSNQPFDMPMYMKAQAGFIRESLDGRLDNCSPEERQKLVAEWLRNHAQSHRDQIILEQAILVDQHWADLEPLLRELLDGVITSMPTSDS